MARVLTDLELAQEWVRYFGPVRGARLMGWAVMTALLIPRGKLDERAIVGSGFGSLAGRYRNMKAIKAFKADLAARGLAIDEADASDDRLTRLVAGVRPLDH